jgi:hypothetical protein
VLWHQWLEHWEDAGKASGNPSWMEANQLSVAKVRWQMRAKTVALRGLAAFSNEPCSTSTRRRKLGTK